MKGNSFKRRATFVLQVSETYYTSSNGGKRVTSSKRARRNNSLTFDRRLKPTKLVIRKYPRLDPISSAVSFELQGLVSFAALPSRRALINVN